MMIKKFNEFSQLNEGVREDVQMAKDYAKTYYWGDPFFDYEDIKKRLIDFARTEFPYGLKNIPKKLTLYRLLNVKSIDDINKDKLGTHFVGDKDMLFDDEFLDSASITNGNDKKLTWYIVTIITESSNLNIDNMLGNRAEYPTEYEFSLLNDENLTITNIENYDDLI